MEQLPDSAAGMGPTSRHSGRGVPAGDLQAWRQALQWRLFEGMEAEGMEDGI